MINLVLSTWNRGCSWQSLLTCTMWFSQASAVGTYQCLSEIEILQCKIEWFHFDCVGIKERPKGKWYCSDCAVVMKRRRPKLSIGGKAGHPSTKKVHSDFQYSQLVPVTTKVIVLISMLQITLTLYLGVYTNLL